MKLRINCTNLAAEFVVVVVGVAIALAADNLREDFNDRSLEKDYLTRIKNELELGRNPMERLVAQFGTAFDSTNFLIDYLENNSNTVNQHLLVEHFTKATRTGGTQSSRVSHNVVYSELTATGRIALIADADLRYLLARYFREVTEQSGGLESLPLSVWERYRELTGSEAGTYLLAGELPSG
jgi:hypothetical protein